MQVLIVGAGFAGAVYARTLAERGVFVRVIDRRDHIAGNCFDAVDDVTGVRLHRYGPHLFHTSNQRVVEWLSRFTDWLPYEHRVRARLADGRLVPLPVNLDTLTAVFGQPLSTPDEAAACLAAHVEERPTIESAEDQLYATIGPELTNLFFRPYTRKMWREDLADMDAAVVKRIAIRTDRDDRYFPNDTFQAIPKDGYTALFARILDHPKIRVELRRSFTHAMLDAFDHCFNSMAIDEFFGADLGRLPYRSIRFHHAVRPEIEAPPTATVNYTDDGPLTRETWWHAIPGGRIVETGLALRTQEEPCDERDNGHERYYPVKTQDGRNEALYARYKARAERIANLTFIGRCGTYQYLDMHQVVNQSLAGAERWLEQYDAEDRPRSATPTRTTP